ncbi:MAG: Rho termination factor N-terminal domain-containing protein [Solirubrobacterales bacterium]|nr:Rho termination factor N-terminal domain-containing protein [Solirubrobacterales bacterium]
MSVLDREALEASPLADLHEIASELSLDGFRRLRKAELVDAIVARQSGQDGEDDSEDTAEGPTTSGRRRRGRRGGRGRGGANKEASEQDGDAKDKDEPGDNAKSDSKPEEETVQGTVELLPNGSGFVRVNGPEPSDDDVYISAAQVKRCELVSGDTVTGPRRGPQRSERFASMIRIDTINDKPASDVADGARYDDLAAEFPNDRFKFDSEDPTLRAIEFLTPFGRGSRVTISGGTWAGKSHTLGQLAAKFAAIDGLTTFVALAGVRPEELAAWSASTELPAATSSVSFAASADAQDHAVELVIDQARRVATRGGDAVVLIDTLDGLHQPVARKALAAARNLKDGGSVTVIATAAKPFGGETTVIALDAKLTSTGRFPALDLAASGTLRPELLVEEAAVKAIADARIEAQNAA